MNLSINRWLSALVGLSLLITVAFVPGQARGDAQFSGQATVINANLAGTRIILVDTGPLPSSGGALHASLLTVSVPGVLAADVADASTIGQENDSRSEASVADVNLTVGGQSVIADFLMASATAQCTSHGPAVSGNSDIVNLVVNGTAITVSGQPNQTVTVGLVTVIINEQSSSVQGNTGSITVNALHVIVNGIADVIISSAHADITCPPPPSPCNDFVTGGGWITGTPSGAKGNFGVAGGIKNGAFWGHLEYIDHGPNGPKVHGTGVTAYAVTGLTSRHIEGTCEINGQSGFTYTVDVADNDAPGTNDTFIIHLSNGYSAGGTLGGGEIQLHKCQ